MAEKPVQMTREERLAAKLRDNLRRRKAQARAMQAPGPQDKGGDDPSQTGSE